MSQIHKCPVCEGRGVMTIGFYAARGTFNPSPMNAPSQDDMSPTPCRSCNGRGIVMDDRDEQESSNKTSVSEEHELREGA